MLKIPTFFYKFVRIFAHISQTLLVSNTLWFCTFVNQLLSERGEDFGSLAIAQFLEFRECWDCPEAKNFSEISGKLPLQSVTPIFTEDPNSPDESIIKQLKDIVGEEIDEMFNSGRLCQTHRWLWDGPSPGSRSRGLLEKSQKFWDWD